MPGQRTSGDVLHGVLAGALGGLAGTAAMYGIQRLLDLRHRRATTQAVQEVSLRGGRQDIAQLKRTARRTGRRQQDATMRAAEAGASLFGMRRLPYRERHRAALALHYLFGAAAGALYGAASVRVPALRSQFGVAYGLAVWLVAAEVALPLLGLAKGPRAYPPRDHASAALSHAAFGATTEAVRRVLRAA